MTMTKEQQVKYLMKHFGLLRCDAYDVLKYYSLDDIIAQKSIVFVGRNIYGWPFRIEYKHSKGDTEVI